MFQENRGKQEDQEYEWVGDNKTSPRKEHFATE
jgi:hypothetical protein